MVSFLTLALAKGRATKAKIIKWDYIKLKDLYTAKETINKMKKKSYEMVEIFANYTSDKKLISKMFKKLI